MRSKKISPIFSRFSVAGLLLFSLLLAGGREGNAGPAEQCLDCHEAVWEEGRFELYRHQPFLDRKCRTCHIDSLAEIENPRPGNRQANPERSRVNWVGRNFTPALNHWFRFYAPEDHDAIFIEADGSRGFKLQEKQSLPPLDELSRYDNDNTPPAIFEARVLEVEKGLFLSAVIGWQTDEPATSVIEYGIDKINHSSPLKNIYTTDHQVAISGIKSGKDYRVRVVSEDFFGNRSTSEEFVLATDKKFSLLEELPANDIPDRKQIEITSETYRSDGQYLVRITADKPVRMALGTLPASRKIGYVQDSDSQADVKHLLTKDAFHLNISTCYGCHRQYQEGMSHPVNVYPKKGIVIPPEYPTLPDGRVTCSSCHSRHASNQKNRLIKPTNKELCVGCHQGMG
jgi:predicted CXXCH cytochrome family protein